MRAVALPRFLSPLRSAWRFVNRLQSRGLLQLAGALTYHAVLALFPGLIVAVALLGVIGLSPHSFDAVLSAVGRAGSSSVVDFVRSVLNSVLHARGHPALLSIGVVVALWAASGYAGSFAWAVGRAFEVPTARSWWLRQLLQLGLAFTLLVFFALAAVVVVFSGPVARWLADLVGLGSSAATVLSVVKWPVLVVVTVAVFELLYLFAPGRCPARFLNLLPGAAVGVLVWLAASALFDLYVANFGSYNRTYGLLGAAVALLVWLWLLNVALLMGAEVNDGLEQRRRRARFRAARVSLPAGGESPPRATQT